MFEVAFDHLHLRSLDPEAAAQFYVDGLGATIAGRVETADTRRLIVALGSIRLFIESAPADLPPGAAAPHRGIEHFGLLVPDLDQAYARLRDLGVEFTLEPTARAPGLRIAFLRGPDDVLIELLERKTV